MEGELAILMGLLLRSPADAALAGAISDLLERVDHPRARWARGPRGYADFDEAFPMASVFARGGGAEVVADWTSVASFHSDRSTTLAQASDQRRRMAMFTRGPFVREIRLSARQWRLVGPRLVRAEPLERLLIYDVSPLQIAPGRWAWYDPLGDEDDENLEPKPHHLPCEFTWIQGGEREGPLIYYVTQGDAEKAMGAAGLWWARWQAGLCEGGEGATGREACYDNRPLPAEDYELGRAFAAASELEGEDLQ